MPPTTVPATAAASAPPLVIPPIMGGPRAHPDDPPAIRDRVEAGTRSRRLQPMVPNASKGLDEL